MRNANAECGIAQSHCATILILYSYLIYPYTPYRIVTLTTSIPPLVVGTPAPTPEHTRSLLALPLCTPLPLCRVYYTLISYVYTYNDRLLHVDDVTIQCRLMKSPGHGVHCHHVTHFIISGGCDWVWRGCRDCDFATRFGSEEIHSEHKYCTGKRAKCRSSCPKEFADRSM